MGQKILVVAKTALAAMAEATRVILTDPDKAVIEELRAELGKSNADFQKALRELAESQKREEVYANDAEALQAEIDPILAELEVQAKALEEAAAGALPPPTPTQPEEPAAEVATGA